MQTGRNDESDFLMPLSSGDFMAFNGRVGFINEASQVVHMKHVVHDDGSFEKEFLSFIHDADRKYVYRLDLSDRVELTKWDPHTCQGCTFPRLQFRIHPTQCWTRSQITTTEGGLSRSPLTNHNLKTILDILLQVQFEDMVNAIEIRNVSDRATRAVLCERLVPICSKLAFRTFQHCDELIGLCVDLCARSTVLTSIAFQGIMNIESESIQLFFEAVAKSNLKHLNLNTSRWLNSVDKDTPGYRSEEGRLNIDCVLAGLLRPERTPPLEDLEVGGNPLECTALFSTFCSTLPTLKIKRLSFRGCSLSEEALLLLARSVAENSVLQYLDLSHNSFSSTATEHMASSLHENKALKTLVLEHCKIDLEQARHLAQSLRNNQYLEHLRLDGNEFAWEPLTEAGESEGAVAILEALEYNKSLLSLEMGEFGKLALKSVPCCLPPPYSTTLCPANQRMVTHYLQRNAEDRQKANSLRAQLATVRIAEILLEKTTTKAN